jgi:hypothetical protein
VSVSRSTNASLVHITDTGDAIRTSGRLGLPDDLYAGPHSVARFRSDPHGVTTSKGHSTHRDFLSTSAPANTHRQATTARRHCAIRLISASARRTLLQASRHNASFTGSC